MTCTVDRRRRARRCGAALETVAPVQAVDVLDPHTDPTQRWTVEIVLAPSAGGLPPEVLSTLAAHQLSVRDVSPQGRHWVAVATV